MRKISYLNRIISCMMTGFILLFALPLTTVSAADTEDVLHHPQLNALIDEYFEIDKTPGMALAVIHDSETVFKNWGYDDLAQKKPITETTKFELASVSKAFTALSVFLLQEEGKLSVEDSVSDYLPWFHVTWQGNSYDVKIWQLLNHCSGISSADTENQFQIGTDDSLKEQTARIAEGIALRYEPGTEFEYSNLGYDILAYLTEVAAEKTFEEYVTEEIFKPLGMKNSGYDLETAQGYQRCFGRLIPYDAPRFKGCQGDGYVITTAEDMTLWMNAQLGNANLPEKLENAIHKSHIVSGSHPLIETGALSDGTPLYYCNGWRQNRDGSYMSHSGGNPNFTTMLYIDKTNQTAVFTASNSQTTTPMMTASKVYHMLLGEPFAAEDVLTDHTDTIASLAALAGLIAMAVLILCILLQKKHLQKKTLIRGKEKRNLIIKLAFSVSLLLLLISAPYLANSNYTLAAVWMPYSVLTALIIWDIDLLLMIFQSILRYVRGTEQMNADHIK